MKHSRNDGQTINPIFLSPSADSAIVAYDYDGWKGERLAPTLSLKGEGVYGWRTTYLKD
jgi:hypothetical protein